MKRSVVILALSILLLLCGCGAPSGWGSGTTSGSPPPPPPPPPPPNLSGNWQLSTTSGAGMSPLVVAGSIVQSDDSLSGAVHIDGPTCFDHLTTVALTGTRTGNEVSLTSTSVAGQVITLTGTLSNGMNGDDSIFTGTYAINGGCAGGDQGNASGDRVYTSQILRGTFTTSGGVTFDMEADVPHFKLPDPNGSYELQGTVFSSNSCFGSATITSGTFPTGSFILGRSVALEAETANGTLTFQGELNQDETEVDGTYTLVGGTCDQTGTGALQNLSPWDY